MAMTSTESAMDFFRPCLSAIVPNNQPPIGRIRKPTAKIPAVSSNCAFGLLFGKNIGEKYKAKQSNYTSRTTLRDFQ
jgi:hypothetical protein